MKKILINTIIIYALCFLTHFGYSTFPNFITSIISPVNESVFEHFKMLYMTSIIFSILSLKWTKYKNFYITAYLRAMISTIILAIIYIPLYYTFGEVMAISLIVLFISILITELIIYKIPIKKHYHNFNVLSAIMLIINIFIFTYLSYNPIHGNLFYDTKHKIYGIYKSK